MNTYTLTQAQYDELHEALPLDVLRILKSLKPNLQKPVGIVSTTPHNGTLASWYPDCEIKHNDLLYTNPTPISKEDMVKVLEALKEYRRAGVCQSTDYHIQLSAFSMSREAITIMQSAIEGMK